MTSLDLLPHVSRETYSRLEQFVALFQKWARHINLAAPSTLSQVWDRHVKDSAQLFALNPSPLQWLDLGSGGGFPGVVTAILLREVEGGWVHLVESNHKKASFLRVALQETGAKGSVHSVRIEDADEAITDIQAVSARALASLPSLLEMIEPWANRNTELVSYLHKGRDYESEIANARGKFQFDLVKHQSRVEPDSVVLEISRLTRRPIAAGARHDAR